jgi:L-fucose mutarotase
MGHGDELAIVDANFPAVTKEKKGAYMSVSAAVALDAVLTLLPLDDFVDSPATVMQVAADTNVTPDTVREFQASLNDPEKRSIRIDQIDRFGFYKRTESAFAVIATSEVRLYGCILIRKGVIRPK